MIVAPRSRLFSLAWRVLRTIAVMWLMSVLLLVAVWQGYVLPQLPNWKTTLTARLSQETGYQVQLGELNARWLGLHPQIELSRVVITPPDDHTAPLLFNRLTLVPAWSSLWQWRPNFAKIVLHQPRVDIRRDRQGHLSINGITLQPNSESDGQLGRWLLQQDRLEVREAWLHFRDERVGLTPITLSHGNITLQRGWFGHEFTLTATPPRAWLHTFRARLQWQGEDPQQWQQWQGEMEVELAGARFAPWAAYLKDILHRQEGEAAVQMKLQFAEGRITELDAKTSISNGLLQFAQPSSETLSVPNLSGHIRYQHHTLGTMRLQANDLSASTSAGKLFERGKIEGEWQTGPRGRGKLAMTGLTLSALKPIIRQLPLDDNLAWRSLDPSGFIQQAKIEWQGDIYQPQRYRFQGTFNDLGWQGQASLPSAQGLSGQLEFSERGGRIRLRGQQNTQLHLPEVFAQAWSLQQLEGDLSWQRQPEQQIAVEIHHLRLANSDLAGEVQGRYHYQAGRAGDIHLTGQLHRLQASQVARYLPLVLDSEVRQWLAQALPKGEAKAAQFRLIGDLDRFPFAEGGGEFSVEGQAEGVTLAFDPAWPAIENIQGTLSFHNEKLTITAKQASVKGVRVHEVSAEIPDLAAVRGHLFLSGRAQGETQNFFRFLADSPLNAILASLPSRSRAEGRGELRLALDIPFADVEKTQVKGSYHFQNNRLQLLADVPPLDQVNGTLWFDQQGLRIDGITLHALGGQSVLTAQRRSDGKLAFDVQGDVNIRHVGQRYLPTWLQPLLHGKTRHHTRFVIHDGLESLSVSSDLRGIESQLPAPLTKPSLGVLPFSLDWQQLATTSSEVALQVKIAEHFAGQWALQGQQIRASTLHVGHSERPVLPQQGSVIDVKSDEASLDSWLALLAPLGQQDDHSSLSYPVVLNLASQRLNWSDYQLKQVYVQASSQNGKTWDGKFQATGLQGGFVWWQGHPNRLELRLPELKLPLEKYRTTSGNAAATLDQRPLQQWPRLELSVGKLQYRGRQLGQIQLHGQPSERGWEIQTLSLLNQDGRLAATGYLQQEPALTSLDVETDSKQLGGFIQRLSGSQALRQGQGHLQGRVQWQGKLADFQTAALHGNLAFRAENGHFAKLDPGPAKLLGVLSLQSLSRRLRLDFRDLVGEGFAFDSVTGNIKIENGIFHSQNVLIQAPAAEVRLQGNVDLVQQQQALRVQVEPRIAESLAIATGAVLLNPAIGIAALAAQKVLQDPVSKLMTLEYQVTGSLQEPTIQAITPRDKPQP